MADESAVTVRCAKQHELAEPPGLAVDQRQPCPQCGSLGRTFNVRLSGAVIVRDHLGVRGRSGGKIKGRRLWEIWGGDDFHRATGTWSKLYRLIDRRRRPAWYSEEIVSEVGDVVRFVEEPLADHQGRGSAGHPSPPPE